MTNVPNENGRSRQRKPLELRVRPVPAPPDFAARLDRAITLYARLLARATLESRCSRCGRFDALKLPARSSVCEACAAAASTPGNPENPLDSRAPAA